MFVESRRRRASAPSPRGTPTRARRRRRASCPRAVFSTRGARSQGPRPRDSGTHTQQSGGGSSVAWQQVPELAPRTRRSRSSCRPDRRPAAGPPRSCRVSSSRPASGGQPIGHTLGHAAGCRVLGAGDAQESRDGLCPIRGRGMVEDLLVALQPLALRSRRRQPARRRGAPGRRRPTSGRETETHG